MNYFTLDYYTKLAYILYIDIIPSSFLWYRVTTYYF